MKILITGAGGFIGSAIAEHLSKSDHIIACHDPPKNMIVHLAAGYGAIIDCGRYLTSEDQLRMIRQFIVSAKEMKECQIILFSSIYGHKAPDFSIYNGTEIKETPLEYAFTKGGIEQAVRYLAQKLKPWNIQVNAIAPGGVVNGHSAGFRSTYALSGGAPMIEPRNILPVVDMLLHPDNAVNGQVITVDGGWSL